MSEKIMKEIEKVSETLTNTEQIIAQLTTIVSLLVEKGVITEEEYKKDLLTSLTNIKK